jgi:Carboxypeptidase regulatory-like domain
MRRRYSFPRLLMPNNFGLPPVECWRGTRPSHAARSLPFRKVIALPFHSLHAQLGSSGGVSGIARASDGSQVSGAKITVSGPGGFSRTTISAPDGAFSFVNLPRGTYTVQSTASGFAPSTQLSVPVAVGRNTQLTVTLTVAGTQETVSVTATQSSFDSSQTSSVVNIDRDRVEELPIPTRNYLSFVALSPQAVPANPSFRLARLPNRVGAWVRRIAAKQQRSPHRRCRR